MKTCIAPAALAVAAVALMAIAPPPAAGQAAPAGTGDIKSRVSSIVERFPAETAEIRDALCAEIVGLGPAALAEILARVQPPGGANDSKARFAVNGLAVYVTRAGAERERLLYVKALLAAIDESPDKDRAAFLITQVQLAGKAEAVKPLAKRLSDKALAGPAAQALQTIGGTEAARALLAALANGKAPAEATVAIVDAIGRMRSPRGREEAPRPGRGRRRRISAAPPAPPWPRSATPRRAPSCRGSRWTPRPRRERRRRPSISASPGVSPNRAGRSKGSGRRGRILAAYTMPPEEPYRQRRPCPSSSRSSKTARFPIC